MSQKYQKPVLLVTSATGNLGYSSLVHFQKNSDLTSQYQLRAACYKESEKCDLVKGLDQVEQYLFDADTIDQDFEDLMQNVDALFLVPSRSGKRVTHVKNFIELAQKNNTRYIVLFSMIRPNSGAWGRDYDEMESLVEKSGIPYSFIRGTMQMQTLFLFTPDISNGVLPLPIRDGRISLLSVNDVAVFAQKLFIEREKHHAKAFHLSGPQLLTGQQMARIASDALEKQVKFVNITPAGCRKLLIDSGLDHWMCDEFIELFGEIGDRCFENEVSYLLTDMTGVAQETLFMFFKKHYRRFLTPKTSMKPVYGPPEGVEEGEKTSIRGKTQVVRGRAVVAESKTKSFYTEEKGRQYGYQEELEKTKSLLNDWILMHESLLRGLRDIQLHEESRLEEMKRFREEIMETLSRRT